MVRLKERVREKERVAERKRGKERGEGRRNRRGWVCEWWRQLCLVTVNVCVYVSQECLEIKEVSRGILGTLLHSFLLSVLSIPFNLFFYLFSSQLSSPLLFLPLSELLIREVVYFEGAHAYLYSYSCILILICIPFYSFHSTYIILY